MLEVCGNSVALTMAAKFLPNHDLITYVKNAEVIEQVKGQALNTVMGMLTLLE